MNILIYIIFFSVFFSVLEVKASTGTFDLFNSDRGQPPPTPPAPIEKPPTPVVVKKEVKKAVPKKPPKPKIQRDFELLGTSQIGHRFTAIMRAPNGKKLIQSWRKDHPIPIRGYTKYVLARIDPRRVQISYPDSAPCRKSKPQIGLSCHVNGRIATLTMRRGKVAAQQLQFDFGKIPAEPKTQQEKIKNNAAAALILEKLNAGNKDKKPLSKADIAKREKDAADRREMYKNFKRRVIKDEDVPPGQRKISTPFGDRLVPIK